MKKSIFSLVTLMVLGMGVVNGKTVRQQPSECPEGNEPPQEMQMHKGGPKHGGKKGQGPRVEPVKSTPKCKCETCVELRKREETMQKVDSLKKEKGMLQHQIDSLCSDRPCNIK